MRRFARKHYKPLPGVDLMVARPWSGGWHYLLYLGPPGSRRWTPMIVLGLHHERNPQSVWRDWDGMELTIYPPKIFGVTMRGPTIYLKTPWLHRPGSRWQRRPFLTVQLLHGMFCVYAGVDRRDYCR